MFFFQKRMIYGIGEVIKPSNTDTIPVRLNYPRSLAFVPNHSPYAGLALMGPDVDPYWYAIRAVIPFVPNPVFYADGVDMDEVLSSPGAESAWGLRFWQGRSFQQLGVSETRLLMEVFSRRFYNRPHRTFAGVDPDALLQRLTQEGHGAALLSAEVQQSPDEYFRPDGMALRESSLHALLVEHIQRKDSTWSQHLRPPDLADVFHELAASPPKPPQYTDKIDIISTRSIGDAPGIPVHYDLTEIKRDSMAPGTEEHARDLIRRVMPQPMRYVDFIAQQYTGGDYGAIHANYVVHSVDAAMRQVFQEASRGNDESTDAISRTYVLNPREDPATRVWRELSLLEYSWNQNTATLELRTILRQ